MTVNGLDGAVSPPLEGRRNTPTGTQFQLSFSPAKIELWTSRTGFGSFKGALITLAAQLSCDTTDEVLGGDTPICWPQVMRKVRRLHSRYNVCATGEIRAILLQLLCRRTHCA